MTSLDKLKVGLYREDKAKNQNIIEQLEYHHKSDEEVLAELIAAEKIAEASCTRCHGSGIIQVPNGADDVEPEECSCQEPEEELHEEIFDPKFIY